MHYGIQFYPTSLNICRLMFQRYRYVPAKHYGVYDFHTRREGWITPGRKKQNWNDERALLQYQTHALFRGPYLDPSAGDGALLDYLVNYCGAEKSECFAVEVDPNLRAILVSKGYTVIGTDWMETNLMKEIGTIVANPPFANDALHIIKMLEYARERGCNLVTLLRQATWDRPASKSDEILKTIVSRLTSELGDQPQVYSSDGDIETTRFQKIGQRKVDWEGVSVEYLGSCFSDAARPTDEPVVLLRVQQKAKKAAGWFDPKDFEMRDYINVFTQSDKPDGALALKGMIPALVAQYNAAERELRSLLVAQRRFTKLCTGLDSVTKEILGHKVDEANSIIHKVASPEEAFMSLRQRFWYSVFNRVGVTQRMPYEFVKEFEKFSSENRQLDFTLANVQQVLVSFMASQSDIMTKVGLQLFDAIAANSADNMVPWKTYKSNDAFKIREKGRVIYPTANRWGSYSYQSTYFMRDLERFLCWRLGKDVREIKTFEKAWAAPGVQRGDSVECWLGKVRWYVNGNVHIYLRPDLIKSFNQFVGEQRKWLDVADGASCAKAKEKRDRKAKASGPVGGVSRPRSEWKMGQDTVGVQPSLF